MIFSIFIEYFCEYLYRLSIVVYGQRAEDTESKGILSVLRPLCALLKLPRNFVGNNFFFANERLFTTDITLLCTQTCLGAFRFFIFEPYCPQDENTKFFTLCDAFFIYFVAF